MNLQAAAIIGGYVGLVWAFGWWGLAGAVVHLAVLVACVPRK